jgi:hypothetical protein
MEWHDWPASLRWFRLLSPCSLALRGDRNVGNEAGLGTDSGGIRDLLSASDSTCDPERLAHGGVQRREDGVVRSAGRRDRAAPRRSPPTAKSASRPRLIKGK